LGSRVVAGSADEGGAGAHLVDEGRPDQVVAGREVPVQRGQPQVRAPRDLTHRHAEAVLSERRSGHLDQVRPVVPGVNPHLLSQFRRH